MTPQHPVALDGSILPNCAEETAIKVFASIFAQDKSLLERIFQLRSLAGHRGLQWYKFRQYMYVYGKSQFVFVYHWQRASLPSLSD